MGLFDVFKGKNKRNDAPTFNTVNQEAEKKFESEFKSTKDGKLQLDFLDKTNDSKSYDTTRILLDGQPINIKR